MGKYRKRWINAPWKRIIETGAFAAMTVSVSTLAVWAMNSCKEVPKMSEDELLFNNEEENAIKLNKWTCKEDN